MDPYLEMQPFWSDFTPRFLVAVGNELLGKLLPNYDVRVEEYLMLTESDLALHRRKPDISILGSEPRKSGALAATLEAESGPAVAELEYPEYDPQTQRRLEIIHQSTQRVVTVFELLSPTNKSPGEAGLNAYLEKRAEFVACPCNLVELDLLRGGERLPMAKPLPAGDYYAYIGRTQRRPRCEVIGWSLRTKLPAIPIPLLPEDGEVALDLQKVFADAYEPAFFHRRLPYDRPLLPPLPPPDDLWMRQMLGVQTT
jgi:hypothetical protein